MEFREAIKALKLGKRVATAGWNGKGMWLAYSPGSKASRPTDSGPDQIVIMPRRAVERLTYSPASR